MGEAERGERQNELKIIPLTQGRAAFVSDNRYEELNQWLWVAHLKRGAFYAERRLSDGKSISTHRQILKTDASDIDHKDGDTLNNCNYNIRPATHSQNGGNQRKHTEPCTSKYKGVSFNSCAGKWQAAITVNRQRIFLGYFKDEEKAAWAYDTAALKYFGEFSRLNFSLGDTTDCELSESDRWDMEEVARFRLDGHPVGRLPNIGHRLVELTGQRFGKLLVLRRSFNKPSRHSLWCCKCDCGNSIVVSATNLKTGHTQSCGCLHLENRYSKLTWPEVALIRLGVFVGMTHRYLAERFHVGTSTVSAIACGRNWKEPPETEELIAAMYEEAA